MLGLNIVFWAWVSYKQTMTFTKAQKIELIKAAAARAAAEKQRWTAVREQVYTVLLDYNQPVVAYDLLANVAKTYAREMSPMSVYRSLDALCLMGLAVRVESLNAYLPCQHSGHDHQHVMLVCDQCGHADEIEDGGISKKLENDAKSHGFAPSRQVLELHGTCEGCKS